jgi:hypothetical protein
MAFKARVIKNRLEIFDCTNCHTGHAVASAGGACCSTAVKQILARRCAVENCVQTG